VTTRDPHDAERTDDDATTERAGGTDTEVDTDTETTAAPVSRARRIASILVRTASWIVVVVAVGLLIAFVGVPRATGSTPYTVLTGSMRPSMPPGTMVVVRPVEPAELAVGDVITYQLRSGEPEVVTHRIIETVVTQEGLEFRTQGDANDAADPDLVRAVQVRGEAWYWLPGLGYLTSGVTSDARTVTAEVVGIGLIGWALVLVVRTVIRARRH
jgi:signal peptidase